MTLPKEKPSSRSELLGGKYQRLARVSNVRASVYKRSMEAANPRARALAAEERNKGSIEGLHEVNKALDSIILAQPILDQ